MDGKRKALLVGSIGLAMFCAGLLGWFVDAWLGGCLSRGMSPYAACAGTYPVDPLVFVAVLVVGAALFGAARWANRRPAYDP